LRHIASAHDLVGDILRDQGDVPAALVAYRASIAILERLVAEDPSDARQQRDLSTLRGRIVDILTADDPNNASRQRDLLQTEFEAGPADAREIPLWKRILDLTCVWLSLPFWLPLMVLIAAWIKISSPGHIFFRQLRIGLSGKEFLIIKFRTMKSNVQTQSHELLMQANPPMTKLDASGDPRIIPGGRILRAMGLDELPQLLNILQGEMSLVGPRPCTRSEFQRYKDWQKERVNAAPGLTGYWQVNGKTETTFADMINMDLFYAKNMSLRMDLTILLKTLPALMVQYFGTRGLRKRHVPNAETEVR
jgi:lipopolysaccharide/colanic/teichoic acid biosynthesis glycosyltransferase